MSIFDKGVVDPHTRSGRAPATAFAGVNRLCAAALEILPFDGVAVVLRSGNDARELVAATDEVIAQLDEWQFTLGQGPCPDSYLNQRAVLVTDLRAESVFQRWPAFAYEATATGAQAMFVFPLVALGRPIGAVQFYAARPGPLTVTDLATASSMVRDLTSVVLQDFEKVTAGQDPQELSFSPFPDSTVAIATGMISEQAGTSIQDAMAQLRAEAFAQHRVMSAVAEDVLARRLTFTVAPD